MSIGSLKNFGNLSKQTNNNIHSGSVRMCRLGSGHFTPPLPLHHQELLH